MRAFAIVIALVGASAVQAATSSCQAQNILDTCLAEYKTRLQSCEANDWSCMCQESTNIITCYNNCPNDAGMSPAQSTKESYCNALKLSTPTTTSSVTPSTSPIPSGNSSSSSSYTSPTGTKGVTKPSHTEEKTPATASPSQAAGYMVVPAKSMGAFAGLLAVVGFFL